MWTQRVIFCAVAFDIFVVNCSAVGTGTKLSQQEGAYRQWDISSRKLDYSLKSCDGTHGPVAGSIPGLVHTDLMSAGLIKLDPYYRYEETNLEWVAETCWQYESSYFDIPDVDLSSTLYINFDSVDTIASYYFNDNLIGKSQNAFHPNTFEISRNMYQSQGNRLKVVLESAREGATAAAAAYPYAVPATENYNVWAEPSSRNFVRKAGSDFGWDWGPAYIPSGVAGGVYLFQSAGGEGRLRGFNVRQTLSADLQTAQLDIIVHVDSLDHQTEVDVRVLLNGEQAISTTVLVGASGSSAKQEQEVRLPSIAIKRPQLWWPVGHGEPHLYEVEVLYGTAPISAPISGLEGKERREAERSPQRLSKRIGLRTVELVQDPILSQSREEEQKQQQEEKVTVLARTGAGEPATLYKVAPATYYLRINGRAVFMRGANYIPIDSFRSRVTAADRAYVLRAALQSNMNMVRVWGGGAYEEDDFYALADELGLLVWQEVMLACALYPRDDAFLAEVAAEVRHQALRLGDHPSIVVFGGNNENEVSLGWFSESNSNRDLYVADYSKLYADTIYPALTSVLGVDAFSKPAPAQMPGEIEGGLVREGSGRAAWVDSSPSNGLLSQPPAQPYVKLWGQASTAEAGDMHFYDYSCDCEAPASYPAARFVSEFGFQSMPSFLGYRPVTLPQDWDRDSQLLLFRQRHQDGNEQMEAQISRHFQLPATCPASASRSFDMYLYLTGLQQGRCYETAINRWRQIRGLPPPSAADGHSTSSSSSTSAEEARARGVSEGSVVNNGYTMGILYWQLNDIWQGPSWAGMEWAGRWKPLQYAARRAYAPVALSLSVEDADADAGRRFGAESSSKVVSMFVVSDIPTVRQDDHGQGVIGDLLLHVTLRLVPWARSGEGAGSVLWEDAAALVRAESSNLLAKVAVEATTAAAAGCTWQTCFLSLHAEPARAVSAPAPELELEPEPEPELELAPAVAYLSALKDAQLAAAPQITLSNFKTESPRRVSFELSANATSPFLFLELRTQNEGQQQQVGVGAGPAGVFSSAAAGWFSDNNFLAEAGQVYRLSYTSHGKEVDVEQLRGGVQVRALQHAYDCTLPLEPFLLD